MLFITRNVLAIHVDNHVITKEMYLEDGGIIFQTYFKDLYEDKIICFQ